MLTALLVYHRSRFEWDFSLPIYAIFLLTTRAYYINPADLKSFCCRAAADANKYYLSTNIKKYVECIHVL